MQAALEPGHEAVLGDTRTLYNEVFLPRMQGFMLQVTISTTINTRTAQESFLSFV